MSTKLFTSILAGIALIASLCVNAQIQGPTSCTVNTTYTYSYSSSTYLPGPTWNPSGGYVSSAWQDGPEYNTTYYANIVWTTTGTHNLTFANYSELIATLSPIYVCSPGQSAGVSLAGPTSICSGSTVQYTATPTNGGTTPSYVWKVNGVTKQSGSSATYSTNLLALNDVVSVTLTSGILCLSSRTASASKTITSVTTPTAVSVSINDPGTLCAGTPITFVATPSNGGSNPLYEWYRNGSLAQGNQYSSSGEFYSPVLPEYAFQNGETMQVKIISNATCYTGSLTQWSNIVTIFYQTPTTPSVSIIGNDAFCEGVGQAYTATSPQTITGYSWTYGGGVPSSSSSYNLSAGDLQSPGSSVQVTVNVSGNCLSSNQASNSFPLTIYEPPTVGTLSVNNSIFCSSGSVDLTLTSHLGNNSWQYRYKDGSNGTFTSFIQFSTSSANSVSYASLTCGPSLPRYYEFRTVVSNGSCPVATSNTATVTVNPPPAIGTLTATNGPDFCSSGTINLNLSSYTGNLDWQYRQKDGTGSWSGWTNFSNTSSNTNSYNVTNNGSVPSYYEFKVTALNGSCTGAETQPPYVAGSSVPVPGVPSPSASSTTEPGNVTFYGGEVPNATTNRWYNAPTPIAENRVGESDNYTTFLSVTTEFWVSSYNETVPCESSVVSITGHVYPATPLVSPVSARVNMGSSVPLAVTNGPYSTYKWWFNGSVLGTDMVLNAALPGTYRVEGTKLGMTGSGFSSYVTVERTFDDQTPLHYVIVNRIKAENISDPLQIEGLPVDQRSRTVTYIGSLGNTLQMISSAASPLKKDIIQTPKYDALGRQLVQYMPYVSGTDDSKFREFALDSLGYTNSEQYAFYQQSGIKIATDTSPYSTTEVEASPLQRITSQTGVGSAWYTAGKKGIKQYLLNRATDNIRLWKVVSGLPASSAAYADYQLYVDVTTDENGNRVKIYTDKNGRQVQKDVQSGAGTWLRTCNVYDDFGRLAYVLTPEGIRTMSGYSPVQEFLDSWAFQYKYDQYGRVVETKPPGAGWQYTVYDPLDRVALTQSADQRTRDEWTFIKYDIYGRAIITGYKVIEADRATVQSSVDVQLYNFEIVSSDATGYTLTRTYPSATASDLLSVNYYDNYNFLAYPGWDAEAHSFAFVSEMGTSTTAPLVTGFPTGSKVRVVNSSTPSTTWLNAVQYYDKEGRPLQVIAENHFGGLDRTTLKYSLRSQIDEILSLHSGPESITVLKRIEYDHAGRILRRYENINNAPGDQLVAQYEYNELGQLVAKNLHKTGQSGEMVEADPMVGQPGVAYNANIVLSAYSSTGHTYVATNSITLSPGFHVQTGNSFKARIGYSAQDAEAHNSTVQEYFVQEIDYRYNVRGWLTSINNAQLNADGGTTNDDTDDYFGMEMLYSNTESALGNTALFNGNISATKWKGLGSVTGDNDRHSYKFAYDEADRLRTATSQMYSGSTWTKEADVKNESITYDDNGNIKTLQRNQPKHQLVGINASYASEPIDNLTFTYKASSGNQLDKVEDATGKAEGFSNGASANNEFTYNADGSISADNNKGIDTIYYNMLGKPWQIVFSDGRKLEYTYGASGQKLKMKFYQGGVVQDSIDYSGGFVYKNGTLDFFASPEGRVVKNGSNFEYQYVISDHQGNTRVLFTSASPAPDAPLANFEDPAVDAQEYLNVPNALPYWASFTAANHTPGGIKVVRMNQDFRIGPARSLKVYPGDKVDMEVWTYYENNTGFGTTSPALITLINAISTVFGGASGGAGEAGAIYDGVDDALNAFGTGGNQGDTQPGAYLNYILFDKDYKLLDMGWTAVPTSALNAQQMISIQTVNISQAGYIFVYLSYENESSNYVQFDDFKVTHTKSNILQYNEYYPFGLQTAGSWTREDASNRYLYNGGNELNENSGWYETFFREYDAALGRFMQVDPLAFFFNAHSPYHYAYNNPMMFNDVLGASGDSTQYSGGGAIPYYHSIESQRIGPFSVNHWAGGATQYSDWSANGGSESYRQAYAAGAIQLGGTQHYYDDNGELQAYADRNGQLGSWQMNVWRTPDRASSNGYAIATEMVFVPEAGNDPFDVSGIAAREPYGFWESFFFGTIEDGVWYNQDGTPRMRGVVSGTPPSWVGGPAGGLRTAGKGLKLLVQQRGVWRHAINGRVASQETLKAAGLLKPGTVPTLGKPVIPEFIEKAEQELHKVQNPGFWNKVRGALYHAAQFFAN